VTAEFFISVHGGVAGIVDEASDLGKLPPLVVTRGMDREPHLETDQRMLREITNGLRVLDSRTQGGSLPEDFCRAKHRAYGVFAEEMA